MDDHFGEDWQPDGIPDFDVPDSARKLIGPQLDRLEDFLRPNERVDNFNEPRSDEELFGAQFYILSVTLVAVLKQSALSHGALRSVMNSQMAGRQRADCLKALLQAYIVLVVNLLRGVGSPEAGEYCAQRFCDLTNSIEFCEFAYELVQEASEREASPRSGKSPRRRT